MGPNKIWSEHWLSKHRRTWKQVVCRFRLSGPGMYPNNWPLSIKASSTKLPGITSVPLSNSWALQWINTINPTQEDVTKYMYLSSKRYNPIPHRCPQHIIFLKQQNFEDVILRFGGAPNQKYDAHCKAKFSFFSSSVAFDKALDSWWTAQGRCKGHLGPG